MKFIPMKPFKLNDKDLQTLNYPVYVQPKLDGWRCIILNGKALTYALKPIPNHHIRTSLEKMFKGLDFFLVDGEGLLMDEKATYQDIQSAYATREGKPDFRYVIFDCLKVKGDETYPYETRLVHLKQIGNHLYFPLWANKVGAVQLIQYWHHCINDFESQGVIKYFLNRFEGVIFRSPNAPYKFGRSTFKEGSCLAYKPFKDGEARIIGCYPLYTNTNDPELDNHGHTKRGHSKEGKIPLPLLGGFIVEGVGDKFEGKTFNVGSGFTEEQRKTIWKEWQKNPTKTPELYNETIKFKYFDVGVKNLPRSPIFIGFRSQEDL